MPAPRQICLKLLVLTEKNSSYSNLALDAALSKHSDLSGVDKRFISALYYGVIERMLTLDKIIEKYSSRPSDKLSKEVRAILRMGVFQLMYMDSVPDSAAVNESVKLAKIYASNASGFVNALLRSFIRSGKKLPLVGVKQKDLSVEYSCPEWIISMWERDYGEKATLSMLESSIGRPPVTARLNTCRFSRNEIISELAADCSFIFSEHIPDCVELTDCGSVDSLGAYKKGMLHVQDISCQLCAIELDPKPNDIVLDMCSAPGGKAFTAAELMGDKGTVLAFDLHEKRVGLIASGAERLGLTSVKAAVNDAKVFSKSMPSADAVLCDVPCSGLGVIRRKPEIKYSSPDDINRLPDIQYDILNTSCRYVKPGGTLVYSTCTLNRAENDCVAERFLSENSDFEPVKLKYFSDYKATITPDLFGGDGFFIAKFRRKE